MGKQQVATGPALLDWNEVDQALKRMGELDVTIQKHEGEMTLRINELKEQCKGRCEGLNAERDRLERQITAFVEERKNEFLRVRSRALTFGVVAYRLSRKIVFRNKKTVVAALKALGLVQYLNISEEPNKDLMEQMDETDLAKVGASRKVEDVLRIEPKIEHLPAVTA